MAKKVLSKIKNRNTKFHRFSLNKFSKAKFLVLFFVILFIAVSVPLVRAAVTAGSDFWEFDFEDGDGLASLYNISIADGSLEISDLSDMASFSTGLISPGPDMTNWGRILLDVEMPSSDGEFYTEDFSEQTYFDRENSQINWDTVNSKITLPIHWAVTNPTFYIDNLKISGKNIVWVENPSFRGDDKLYRCNVDRNGSDGGCLPEDEKILLDQSSSIRKFDLSGNKIIWEGKVCDLTLSYGEANSCYIDDVGSSFFDGEGKEAVYQDGKIYYINDDELRRYDLLAGEYEVIFEDEIMTNSPDSLDVSSSGLAWIGSPSFYETKIYFYSFAEEYITEIYSSGGSSILKSRISGENAAWVLLGSGKLIIKNTNTGDLREIDTGVGELNFDISGDYVAYYKEGEIKLYQISTGEIRVYHNISQEVGSVSELYFSGNKIALKSIVPDGYANQVFYVQMEDDFDLPVENFRAESIYKDRLVGKNSDNNLFVYNFNDGYGYKIFDHELMGGIPDIYENKIVWSEGGDIYMCDILFNGSSGGCLSTDDRTIISDEFSGDDTYHFLPKISDEYVAWLGAPTFDFFIYNLETEGLSTIDANPFHYDIYKDIVVWIDVVSREVNYCQIGSGGSCLSEPVNLSDGFGDGPYGEVGVWDDYIAWKSNSKIYLYDIRNDSLDIIYEGSSEELNINDNYMLWYDPEESISWIYYIPLEISWQLDNYYSLISESLLVGVDSDTWAKPMLKYLDSGVVRSTNVVDHGLLDSVSLNSLGSRREGDIAYSFSVDGDTWIDWESGGTDLTESSENLFWQIEMTTPDNNLSPQITDLSLRGDRRLGRGELDILDSEGESIWSESYQLGDRENEIDLSGLNVAEYPGISMSIDMESFDLTSSPVLSDWRLEWDYDGGIPPRPYLASIGVNFTEDRVYVDDSVNFNVITLDNFSGPYTPAVNLNLSVSDSFRGGFLNSAGEVSSELSLSMSGGSREVIFVPLGDVEGDIEIEVCSGSICGHDSIEILAPICGNNRVDPGEQCDDGRQCLNDSDELVDCAGDEGVCAEDEVCRPVAGDGCSEECEFEYLNVFITSMDIENSSMNTPADERDGLTTGKIWFELGEEMLTGVEAADQICQTHAEYAGLAGNYKAWLSTGSGYSPAASWEHDDNQYRLTNGRLVADNWDALISRNADGNYLENSINFSASGLEVVDRKPFTSTLSSGSPAYVLSGRFINDFCQNWTSDSVDKKTTVGASVSGVLSEDWTDYEDVSAISCDVLSPLYCFQQASVIESVCGNGVIEDDEECDDGNLENGDGCSSSCVFETREISCDFGPSRIAADGRAGEYSVTCMEVSGGTDSYCTEWNPSWDLEYYEETDPDNPCAFECATNHDWNTESGSCVARVVAVCGNGEVEADEECDDGNTASGDGCSSDCTIESSPGPSPEPDPPISDGGTRRSVCGNGVLEVGEDCDDGNLENGDGCSDACKIEEPLGGGPLCGDGNIDPDEECDGGSLGGMTCENFEPFNGGTLVCNSDCQFDISGCHQKIELAQAGQRVIEKVHDNFAEPIVTFYKESVLGSQQAQKINKNMVAPTITAVAAINLFNALPLATTALPFLQYLFQFLNVLFTEPTYIFAKRKRKWGIVYDSMSKEPLALAVVRLYDAQTNKLIATRVTDSSGRYYFVANSNKQYRISVKSGDYNFPAEPPYEINEYKDEVYRKSYYGGVISLASQKEDGGDKENANVINLDIPLDLDSGVVKIPGYTKSIKAELDTWDKYSHATEKERSNELKRIQKKARERKISNYIAFFGFAITTVSLLVSPSVYLLAIFALHSLLLATFIFLANKNAAKSWGYVFDKISKEGITKAVVRLFDRKRGKLLMTQVTSKEGNYGFLAEPKGKYYVTAEKEKYQMVEDKLEVKGGEEGVIKKDVEMIKKEERKNNVD